MILVTTGTNEQPFDRLVRAAAELAEGEDAFVQYGASREPHGRGEWVDFLDFDVLAERMREARVVVCHAGVGSIMLARRCGHRPVVMPRRFELGEAVDDHQLHLAPAAAPGRPGHTGRGRARARGRDGGAGRRRERGVGPEGLRRADDRAPDFPRDAGASRWRWQPRRARRRRRFDDGDMPRDGRCRLPRLASVRRAAGTRQSRDLRGQLRDRLAGQHRAHPRAGVPAHPRGHHRALLRRRARRLRLPLRLPGVADRLPAAAAADAQGRLLRHAPRARAREAAPRPLPDRLDVRGVRRSAGAPAAGVLLGPREPDRPARRLRRGQAVRRGADDGLPPPAGRGHVDRADLQHLRRADAPVRRARDPDVPAPGAAGPPDHDVRRRLADPLVHVRQRPRRRPDPPRRVRPPLPGEHRQPERVHADASWPRR